jgi:hypothetical protein
MQLVEKNKGNSENARTKNIGKIFLINKISCTIIIPVAMARKHGLNHPSHVVIEDAPNGGIWIRKLDVD